MALNALSSYNLEEDSKSHKTKKIGGHKKKTSKVLSKNEKNNKSSKTKLTAT
jgi:hypothetical protein